MIVSAMINAIRSISGIFILQRLPCGAVFVALAVRVRVQVPRHLGGVGFWPADDAGGYRGAVSPLHELGFQVV